MNFSMLQYLLWALFFVVEGVGVWLLIHPRYRSFRWFLGFCMWRDAVVLIASFISLRTYFYTYWVYQSLELIWLAQLCSVVLNLLTPTMKWWVRYTPVLAVVVLTVRVIPFRHTAAFMLEYQSHCLFTCLLALSIGLAFREKEDFTGVALSLAWLVLTGIAGTIAWTLWGWCPKTWSLMWTLALSALLFAVSKMLSLYGTPPRQIANRKSLGM